MSSGKSRSEDSTHPELEEMLRGHDVSPELAARIRALVGRVADSGESGTRHASPSEAETDPSAGDGERSLESTVVAGISARGIRDDSRVPLPADPTLVPVELIASGGMGKVHRVRDLTLDRRLAMKSLHEHYARVPHLRRSFLDEARITAQLAHPSIPPVHALGELADSRPYFTMKEVYGRTLGEVIEELGDDPSRSSEWSEHRRLEVFQRVCEAVAYAHARGVIHCDIKPPNVMVGAFGEVLVMDWGVARLVEPASSTGIDQPPVQLRESDGISAVAGTPAYMPPEQATGDLDELGPPSDVYSLGVLLYELLTGKRPYEGNPAQLLFYAATGEIPPIPHRPGSIVDDALFAIIVKAMAPTTEARHPDAGALAQDLAEWREGARKRERALELVAEAEAILRANAPERARAKELRAEAAKRLSALHADASLDERSAAWELLDEAEEIEGSSALRTEEAVQRLGAALLQAPENPEAQAMVADIHYERHQRAVARRDWHQAARHELRLRAHDVGRYADYLEHAGRLRLETDVQCEVLVHRFVSRGRRLIPELVCKLGSTDSIDLELPIGSYLVELVRADSLRVRHPVVLERGKREAPARRICVSEALRADGSEVLVPASVVERADGSRLELDGFVIQRAPVTFAEFAGFVITPEAAAYQARFLNEGLDLFAPRWPVVGVSWGAAEAYAKWYSARTGQAWRLPTELEWERAACGVDGRIYPFGDFIDGAFCHIRAAGQVPSCPRSVDQLEPDVSPYGVRGMAGNVRDWCSDRFAPGARVVRGGSWQRHAEDARVRTRAGLPPELGYADVGFRLARSLTPTA